MADLKNSDGRPYLATCCNVVAEHVSSDIDLEYFDDRIVDGEEFEVLVTEQTHHMICPNDHCRTEFEVYQTTEERQPFTVDASIIFTPGDDFVNDETSFEPLDKA